jgi:uncharacterized protein (DUF427 family)
LAERVDIVGLVRRIEPAPGQRSVWDFPRPPIVENEPRRVRVVLGGEVIAETAEAKRILERSHPPGIYLPPTSIAPDALRANATTSVCEWKGRAVYFDVGAGEVVAAAAAWSYPDPRPGFAAIAGFVSFYPGRVDACFLGEERVTPQEGGFYGGWITADVIGPFKGAAGTHGW